MIVNYEICSYLLTQVQSLISYHVVKVACGSGDAQTLCITSDDNVWSWGDGDYGKLGHNISESCKVCIIFNLKKLAC